ncbi:MAG: hypothetical protein ACRC28_13320 [Clostridium sp.]
MIFWIIGYIIIFIIVIALCKSAARADKKSEEMRKNDKMDDINYKE